MSLNEAINEHATVGEGPGGTYPVTRTTGGTWLKGRYTDGAESTFNIVASVQPVGEDLVDVPEGRSSDDVRVIYTETMLVAHRRGQPDDTTKIAPDVIRIDGDDYEVYKVSKWDHWGETHYVAYASKIAP